MGCRWAVEIKKFMDALLLKMPRTYICSRQFRSVTYRFGSEIVKQNCRASQHAKLCGTCDRQQEGHGDNESVVHYQ